MTINEKQHIRLSICIATLNRGDLIAETLDSIVMQLSPGVEVVVVDGASTDNTFEVLSRYEKRHKNIHYVREITNSGLDADYDKAVGYAQGEYCWLMTDDDLLLPEAVSCVLEELKKEPELLVVDAEVRNADFTRVLQRSRLFIDENRHFEFVDDVFFSLAGDALSFIASVVVRRQAWLSRDRESFYGSLFIHVGVIFQAPAFRQVVIMARPLISIRYGNAMWAPRSFEIWMFKWPGLLWSFPGFSDAARNSVCSREPWRNTAELMKHRAKGSYGPNEYRKYIAPRANLGTRMIARMVAIIPAKLLNILAVVYVISLNRTARLGLDDLLNSVHANRVSRLFARLFPLAELD